MHPAAGGARINGEGPALVSADAIVNPVDGELA
jgi:hypothetical protein